ncbi:MAG: flagellar hook basal-body protein [Acidobacteria bacterium]|nr:flagellar hook basal-body protein [Acidobacteriota bacterium]
MAGSQYIALSGMRTRLDQLDRLAADIANVGTAGYKTERAADAEAGRPQFSNVLQSAIDVTSGDRRLDVTPGTLATTGRDLDMAIEGAGFFVVDTPAGPRYTRNGHFSRGADGTLVTDDGSAVQGTNGPLKIGQGEVSVEQDGTVKVGGAPAGRLKVVTFDNPSVLVPESGAKLRADNLTPTDVKAPSVRGGSLEQSNVSLVSRVAELTGVTRSFEALQKALSLMMNDIDGRAIDQLGRIR